MQITACLIVRDEEQYLDACLSQLSGRVDEIVVVDTGSTDRSMEIARAHGVRLFEEPWHGDFATARNIGLDHASGDWILYIDADEQLRADTHLCGALQEANAVAGTVRFRSAQNLTPYPEYRLFRNRPDLRFRGVIHETILPDLNVVLARGGSTVIDTPFLIEHYGYEGDLTHKHQRNRDLLYREVQEDPKRVYLWYALGECEQGLGNLEQAESAWRNALDCLRRGKGEPVGALVYAKLLKLHIKEQAVLPDFDELLLEANHRHGDDPLVLWWSARAYLLAGEPANARRNIEKLLAHGPDGPTKSKLGYERRLFGESGWGLMGVCYLSEGNPAEAVKWLQRAHDANPENTEISAKLVIAKARARQASSA
jgi:glycosyltransferase involved in cell wall biosynthesis